MREALQSMHQRYMLRPDTLPACCFPVVSLQRSIDCTVKQQLGYILGDTRSFVVGYGVNPPTQPHHRSSSCPSPITSECSWDAFNSKDPNPQTLYGALVGGPGADDSYIDARDDFIKNEVATDYNAGFTGTCFVTHAKCTPGFCSVSPVHFHKQTGPPSEHALKFALVLCRCSCRC